MKAFHEPGAMLGPLTTAENRMQPAALVWNPASRGRDK